MLYYSVGTPIGKLNEGNQRYIYRENQLFSISKEAFEIWIKFLHGADTIAIYNCLRAPNLKDTFEAYIESLVNTEMLVREEYLKQAKCLRQGYGIGLTAPSGECAVFNDSPQSISYRAFVFWSYCDGNTSVEDIMSRIQSQTGIRYQFSQSIRSIRELLKKNLIVIVN